MPLHATLRFLQSPGELGLNGADSVTFTVRFRAEGPAPFPTPTPTPTRRPVLGAKLTVALNTFDNEIMDHHVAGKNVGMFSFNHAQDYLIGVEPDNTLTNAWGCADSWEMIDGSTWDIDIRKGLLDHDGVEITEDGVWNMDRLVSDEAVGGFDVFSGSLMNIYKNSEALDAHKFRINLLQDYAFMFNILPPIGGSDGYVPPQALLGGQRRDPRGMGSGRFLSHTQLERTNPFPSTGEG